MNNLILIFFILISLFFVYRTYTLTKMINSLQKTLIEEYTKNYKESDTIQEQFLKFVSDSREWAFDYIENVQTVLEKLVKISSPVIAQYANEDIQNDRTKRVLFEIHSEISKMLPDRND